MIAIPGVYDLFKLLLQTFNTPLYYVVIMWLEIH